jgi:hypothetical protein
MTDYTWTITALDYEDQGAITQVVTMVHWNVTGTDGTHKGRSFGAFEVGEPGDDFTAFENLTPEMVKSWIDDAVIAEAEANVAFQISRKVANAAVNKGAGVPW